MSIHVENNRSLVRVSSENQNIWAPGERAAIEWHEYFPIIGGDRSHYEVVSAKIVEGLGKVTIDGERLNWDPEGQYDGLLNDETELVVVEYTLEDENGDTQTRTIEIEARGTLAGTGYVIPETGQTSTDELNFAAIDAADILRNQVQFDTVKPIDLQWNAMDALQPVIDELLSGLIRTEARAESLYLRTQANANRAASDWEACKDAAAHINEVMIKKAAFDAAVVASNAADAAYNGAVAAKNAWDDANVVLGAKQAALFAAQQSFNIAQSALNSARAVETSAKATLSSATSALNGFIDQVQGFGGFVPPFVSDVAQWIAEFLGIDDDIDAANTAVDNAQAAVTNAVNAVTNAQSVFTNAQTALNAAENAVDAAIDTVADRADDLADALAGQTLGALQRIKAFADAAEDAAEDAWRDARQDMWDDGVLVGQNPTASDLVRANKDAAVKLAALGTAEAAEAAAYLAWRAAQETLEAAQDGANTTDVSVEATAAVTFEAQAGLQVDLVLDGGSIDSDIDYAVDTTTTLDTEADTLTLNAFATNQTTGESVAFETVSPNMSLYAGIVYNIDAHFEMLLDLYAKVAGVELMDIGPLTFDETLSMDGWIDILDVDTTELDSFDVPIPTWVGDILSLEVSIPTVKTEGKEHEVDASVYTDPTGFSMDELVDAILNIAETKLDFSPEFRAVLIEQGMKDNVFSSDLGQAFADALGAILKTVVGEGDTDGDGLVPIFMIDNKDAGVDGLFHINNIADVISEVDIDEVGAFGFFYAEGESDNVFQVSVDVDQLIATAVNVALKNAPDTTINPLDLSIGLDTIAEKAGIPAKTLEKIKKFVKVEFGIEAADFDVRAGANFSQKFALSVDDMDWNVTFEDGTTGLFKASEGGEIVVEDASELVDTNGNGQIDYTLALTPDATLFNDTQIGLNIGYTLDFIKAQAEFMATLPLDEVFEDVDWSALGFEIPTDILSKGFDFGVGPVLRAEGDLDLLSADIFESIFAYNAGSAVIEGAFTPVEDEDGVSGIIQIGNGAANRLVGTKLDDILKGLGGKDVLIGKAGDDDLAGGAGKDKVKGGAGNDMVSGGAKRDTLRGNAGDDEMRGGAGGDVINGGKGDDTVTGGGGNDAFIYTKGDGNDVLTDFEAGADVIRIKRGANDLNDLTFSQVGDDVEVGFANVSILVEDITVAVLENNDNFAF